MTTVFFSCEIGQREYFPRLLLGMYLARNFRVSSVIGHKFTIKKILEAEVFASNRDIFVHKDGNDDSIKYASAAKKIGLGTVACDEEYINHRGIDDVTYFASTNSVQWFDAFFSSTVFTHSAAQSIGFNCCAVGNLRIASAQLLSSIQGNIVKSYDVCINSITGLIFNLNPMLVDFEIACRLSSSHSIMRTLISFLEKIVLEKRVFEEIINDIRCYTRDNKSVIIRPHPAEAPTLWKVLARELEINVDDSGVSSLLRTCTSKSLSGFDCTTLIESAYLGVPCINKSLPEHYGKFIATEYIERLSSPESFNHAREQLSTVIFDNDIFASWARSLNEIRNFEDKIDFESFNGIETMLVKEMPQDVKLRKGNWKFRTISPILAQLFSEEYMRSVRIEVYEDELCCIYPARH